MNGWDILGLIAIALGFYAAMPQLVRSFKQPESLQSLTFTLTGCLVLNNLIWLIVDWHYNLPIFVIGGIVGMLVVLTLLIQQIRYKLRKRK